MIALHAVLSPVLGPCLWAERTGPADEGEQDGDGAPPHPFAAPPTVWGDDVPGTPTRITVWLPSAPGGGPPRPSDVLTATGAPVDPGPALLAAWSVPALVVAGVPATPAGEAQESASVTVLRALERFAADLVARGRLLPAVVGDALRWRAVLQGPDLVAADAFAAALPAVARAVADPATGALPEAIPAVTAALDRAVDRAARARLGGPDGAGPGEAPGWLAGLVSPHPEHRQPAALGAGLARWSVVGAPHAGPARASFRLEEVVVDDLGHAADEAGPRFHLAIALAATEDPSLVVPAATVWRDPGSLRRWLDEPAEVLLAELERAARAWPELGEVLHTRRPTGVDLDLEGAHRFLVDGAAALDRAGFAVLLPASWDGTARLGLSGRAREQGPEGEGSAVVAPAASRIGRERLVDLSWRLAVDGEPLTAAELATLAAAKAPLLRRRGRWVGLDPERLRAGLEFLAERAREPRPLADLARLAVADPERTPGGLPLPVEDLETEGELGLPVDVDAAVEAELRPYQRRGVAWLATLAAAGVGGVLADDMGLGKTLQVLALEAAERAGGAREPTLLVCPTSVITSWVREAARFTPTLRVVAHHGVGRDHEHDGRDLVVTSYGTLLRDVEALAGRRWHRLVLDEAQFVKNHRSRAAKAVRRIPTRHRLALTGTPVENRLGELWAIVDAVEPGLLGSVGEFRDRYAVPVERHGRTDVAAALRRRVRPIVLRRRKSDPEVAPDLPEKIETVERCGLTTEQATLYQAVVDDLLRRIDRFEPGERQRRRGRILAAMTELKQICDHPALVLGDGSPLGRRSGKVRRVEEILVDVLAAGERALLFTQYTAFGDALVPYLADRLGVEVAWLHGGTPRRERDAMVARFQRGEGPPLFVLSVRAGGTGITLTGARHVVHLDRWWNPAVEDQATDRAHRIGQHATVHVHRMMCTGTIEERIDDLVADKRALAEGTLASAGGPDDPDGLGDLSTAAIARLVALDEDEDEDTDADDEPDEPDEGDGATDDGP